jgi:hypothetical protein
LENLDDDVDISPQVADGGDNFEILRVAANVLNKQ